MRGNFDCCLTLLWSRLGDAELEDPHQPKATRLGISRKTLAAWKGTTQSRVDLNAMQKGEASAILHVWFWRAVHGDDLPQGLDRAMFEKAVAEGPKAAITALQATIGVHPTGELIPRDLRKIEALCAADIIEKIGGSHVRAA